MMLQIFQKMQEQMVSQIEKSETQSQVLGSQMESISEKMSAAPEVNSAGVEP